MQQTITITPQWQIYLPQQLRKAVGLKRPGKAIIEVKNKNFLVKPQESQVLKLAGKYRHLSHKAKEKGINIDKIRDYIDYSDL